MMQNELFEYTKNDDGIHITKYIGKEKDIVVPDTIDDMSVVAIEEDAFADHGDMTSIVLPNTLTKIGAHAFVRCVSITSITIPSSVTEIGEEAFIFCRDLSTVTIPSSVTQMEEKVFYCCDDNLVVYTEIESRPEGWKKDEYFEEPVCVWNAKSAGAIGGLHYAVMNDNSITISSYYGNDEAIVIPSQIEGLNVTCICKHAFYKCDSLMSVTIPKSVKTIEPNAFSQCNLLLIISAEAVSKPDGWSDEDNDYYPVIWDCVNNDKDADGYEHITENGIAYALKDGEAIVKGLINCNQSICLPDTITHNDVVYAVTDIGNNAFYNCDVLNSVTFGANSKLQSIGAFAFGECTKLEEIVIPEGTKTIGDNAFGACTSLRNAILPITLTSIGNKAFYNCCSLERIFIPESVTSVGENGIFMCNVYAAAESKPKGWNANWKDKDCTVIWNVKSMGTKDDCVYTVMSDDTITITQYIGGSDEVLIPSQIDGISVTAIGKLAFAGSSSIKSVYIPSSVQTIEKGAFKDCNELQNVNFEGNKSCENISLDAFSNCKKLKNTAMFSNDEDKILLDGNSCFESEEARYVDLRKTKSHGKNMIWNIQGDLQGGYEYNIHNLDYIIVYKSKLTNINFLELQTNMMAGYLLDPTVYGPQVTKDYESSIKEPLIRDVVESSIILGRQYVLDALEKMGIDCTPYDYHADKDDNIFKGFDVNNAIGYVEHMAYTENVDIINHYVNIITAANENVGKNLYCDLLNIFINYRSLEDADEFIKKNIEHLNPECVQYLKTEEYVETQYTCLFSKLMQLEKSPLFRDNRIEQLRLVIKNWKGKLGELYYNFTYNGEVEFVKELISSGEKPSTEMEGAINSGAVLFNFKTGPRRSLQDNTDQLLCCGLIAESIGIKLTIPDKLFDVKQLFDINKVKIYSEYCKLPSFSPYDYLNELFKNYITSFGIQVSHDKESKDASFELMMKNHLLDGVDLTEYAEDLAMPENAEYAVALIAVGKGDDNSQDLDIDEINIADLWDKKIAGDEVILKKYLGSSEIAVIPGSVRNIAKMEIDKNAFDGTNVIALAYEGKNYKDVICYANYSCDLIPSRSPKFMNFVTEEFSYYNYRSEYEISYPIAYNSTTNAGVQDGFLWVETKDKKITIVTYLGCNSEIIVPYTIDGKVVNRIAINAFRGNDKITNITLSSSIEHVGMHAFADMQNLESVKLSPKMKYINYELFINDNKLKNIDVPLGVENIGIRAFNNCSSLTSINIPSSVTSIDGLVFSGCRSLKSITIPNSVKSIESCAFGDCSSLTIYAEAKSQPRGWHEDWNIFKRPVVWGYKK